MIDEADRMVQQGSFPQLKRILEAVHVANPLESDSEDEEDEDDADVSDRMLGLPGIPGEARVQMMGDVLARIEEQKEGSAPTQVELDDDEYEDLIEGHEEESVEELDIPSAPPVTRQTFVYSATLTLPPSEAYASKKTKRKKGKKQKQELTVDGALAEIMEQARAAGKTKVVDLTTISKKRTRGDNSMGSVQDSISSRLPPGLTLRKIECTQRHKDSFLYAYLVTTAQGASGPCIVFCNSIAAVRRIGTTLQTLRLPVKMLHANMPQVRSCPQFFS